MRQAGIITWHRRRQQQPQQLLPSHAQRPISVFQQTAATPIITSGADPRALADPIQIRQPQTLT